MSDDTTDELAANFFDANDHFNTENGDLALATAEQIARTVYLMDYLTQDGTELLMPTLRRLERLHEQAVVVYEVPTAKRGGHLKPVN